MQQYVYNLKKGDVLQYAGMNLVFEKIDGAYAVFYIDGSKNVNPYFIAAWAKIKRCKDGRYVLVEQED